MRDPEPFNDSFETVLIPTRINRNRRESQSGWRAGHRYYYRDHNSITKDIERSSTNVTLSRCRNKRLWYQAPMRCTRASNHFAKKRPAGTLKAEKRLYSIVRNQSCRSELDLADSMHLACINNILRLIKRTAKYSKNCLTTGQGLTTHQVDYALVVRADMHITNYSHVLQPKKRRQALVRHQRPTSVGIYQETPREKHTVPPVSPRRTGRLGYVKPLAHG